MSLSKILQEYREGLRGLPTYEELAAIAASIPMTQKRFNEKMDELDKSNPAPLARLMADGKQCADPIVERNVSLLRERSAVGVQKYGTTLADNKLPLRAWLNHALEEALDQANYLQAAMAEIDSAERALPPLPQYFPDVENIRADEELRAQQYAQDYARSALAVSPVQAQEPKPFAGPGAWFTVDVLGNPMREYSPGKWENCVWPSCNLVQPVAVPDDIPVDIPKAIPEKDHYVYLRGYYDGERAAITAKTKSTPQ